ncbi:amidase [Saccharopolyspora griseoalba]|uniref:Amidase n=1 Tax=Saccharopolyspora griseoalba TaxID=1431848 RepID=A0ABW2LLS9_9PSEU
MDVSEYLEHDGLGLAGLIAEGEVTAPEVLAAARERARAVNPRINAVVRRLDEHADQRAAQPLTGQFAGVPFLLKDLHQDLAGYPTSNGCRAYLNRPATWTSTVVQRWLDAGLVIFGKTNTPAFGVKGTTDPEVFGPTRNPWNLERTPGGSSGGSAAAVAAGIVPAAAASDGGGSIRIPAACNGLVGLKPGRGLVPAGPGAGEPLNGLSTNGVISRTVRDTAALLDVVIGEEADSPFAAAKPGGLLDALEAPPGRLRVGWTARCALRPEPHPEAVRAVERAAELLAELGHEVEEVDPPHDDRQLGRDFLSIWIVGQAIELARAKRETGCGDEGFELETLLLAALGEAASAVRTQAAQERRAEHTAALAAFHDRYDLLLTPTLAEPPIRIGSLDMPAAQRFAGRLALRTGTSRLLKHLGVVDEVVERNLAWVPFTQLANLTGRPAISLPLHRTPDDLPLGVQFVGPLRSEPTLLRLARQLEEAAPWSMPSGFA